MLKHKVIIMGGGVAGMSAAHELVERGFEVEVYERNDTYAGGKARSVDAPQDSTITGKPLPGEHGFRFFPGFYKHITDTMKRIPFQKADGSWQRKGCYGNLVPTTRIMLARYGKEPIVTTANFPRNPGDIKLLYSLLKNGGNTGLTSIEKKFFIGKIWQLATSCYERKRDEYEKLGWWEFLEAERFSETYRHLLVGGLVRTLVAAQPKSASTKTGGNIFLQLVYNITSPGISTDRVLNGPTNDKWLTPWLKHLQSKGVKYHLNHEVLGITTKDGLVDSVKIKNDKGEEIDVSGHYYLLATPVEAAAKIIETSKGLTDIDDTLSYIPDLAKEVSWMNGIQYYLNEEVNINNGHIIYCDSEWAVTSISQSSFWTNYDLEKRYNGKVKGIISVDVSDWLNTKFSNGKLAKDCTYQEIADCVWEQIEKSLNVNGKTVLRKDMIVHYYLDSDIRTETIQEKNKQVVRLTNLEPLLVNTVHSWTLRPEARSNVKNLFLASDYVRTYTDLATMEGANEAARRAVNCIIDAADAAVPYCKIWKLSEPWVFLPLKWYDQWRYARGLPHSAYVPWYLKGVMILWGSVYALLYIIRAVFAFIFAERS